VVVKKVVVVWRGGVGGWGGVGKCVLVEGDVSRYDYFAGRKVETAITTMLRRVSKEDTFGGSRGKFVFGGGEGVDITEASENAEILVARCATV
jgi:hypothetical protein